jgi:DNA-binding HxlR family transcriptional regulator
VAGDEEHAPQACDAALAQAFGFLGKRWNGVLLGVLAQGPASFSGLRRAVAGISDSVLSDRLGELGTAGLVLRTVAAGPPVGVRYELTTAGAALVPVLDHLARWSADHLSGPCAGAAAAETAEADATAG